MLPEELFGPICLQGLAQDRFVRLTTGKLPEVEFAFVDEIFTSNNAVLKALLSIITHQDRGHAARTRDPREDPRGVEALALGAHLRPCGDYRRPDLPIRNVTPIAPKDANEAFKCDLAALGLRVVAGAHRDRGRHDLRSWFITTCQKNGAHRDLLRVVTHPAKGDVVSGYTRATWGALCAEVAKLRVSTLDGEILPLATVFATAELKAANRWRNVATPLGLEGVSRASTISEDPPVTDGDTGSGPDAGGPSRTQVVASLATRLADAVLAGDHERARALAEELQELAGGAPTLRAVR